MAPGRGLRDVAGAAYVRAGVARNVVMTVPTFTAAAATIAETDYVASLPASLLRVLGPKLGVQAVSGPVPQLSVRMELSWHERTHTDPAMIAFRALVKRALPRRAATRGKRSIGRDRP
jgi:DNA-binding transcriptional LysR family regulator